MTSAADLLPASSGPFTRALAHAATDDLPVPIRQIVDPAETPPGFLPFLAVHEGVRLWFEDWSIERKRTIIANWTRLASLIGTRSAFSAFLVYVDAQIVDRVAHPRRFVVGRAAAGITPIGQKPFVSHLLVKVGLVKPPRAFVVGRSAVGKAAVRSVDREPLRRVNHALTVAKAPETLVTVNFGHRRPVTLDDGFELDGSFILGGHLPRKRL